MGFYSGAFFSRTLEMDTQLGVILPQDSRKHHGFEQIKEGVIPRATPKTLILLHGLGDNFLVWESRTSILRYAEEYDVAVLMPEVQRSFYQDMKEGRNYFKYITEELPEYAASVFNISVAPEDLMIAGLSMGGYGALRCGLTYPEKYSGVGVFSSAWNIEKLYLGNGFDNTSFDKSELLKDRTALWGDKPVIPDEASIHYLLDHYDNKNDLKLYLACGTEDFLFEDHKELLGKLDAKGIPYKNTYLPGIHEWAVWDRVVQEMLDYFIRGNEPAERLLSLK